MGLPKGLIELRHKLDSELSQTFRDALWLRRFAPAFLEGLGLL